MLSLVKCYKNDRGVSTLKNLYDNVTEIKCLIEKLFDGKPFEGVIYEDQVVLLKPNWVVETKNINEELCLITHHNFILAVLEMVLVRKPKRVIIADAPIQRCKWDKLHPKHFFEKINKLSREFNIPIVVKDYRCVILEKNGNSIKRICNSSSDSVIFDLGHNSLLEPISLKNGGNFRVNCYDHKKLSKFHRKGVHKYCISKDIFDCDVILTLPKVKTHQKVGLTNALKILVGVNGNKDYLPHHRVGGVDNGGDCYPGKNFFRRFAECFLDLANINRDRFMYYPYAKLSKYCWRLAPSDAYSSLTAGWYGNDTTWRMVLDINRIVEFGLCDGTISKNSERKIYSLCDGIIGGHGNGPLNPVPLPLGFISFSDDSFLTDLAFSILFNFNFLNIPLLKSHIEEDSIKDYDILLNGKLAKLNILKEYSISAKPPPGWLRYIENI